MSSTIYDPDFVVAESRIVACLTVDSSSWKILHVTSFLERTFGYHVKPGELIGMDVDVLVPEDSRPQHRGFRERYAKDPTIRPMGLGMLLNGRRRDGTVFPAVIALGAVVINGVDCVIVKVTELHQVTPK